MKDDSIAGIYSTLTSSALISKSAGGIGIAVSNIRSKYLKFRPQFLIQLPTDSCQAGEKVPTGWYK